MSYRFTISGSFELKKHVLCSQVLETALMIGTSLNTKFAYESGGMTNSVIIIIIFNQILSI